LCETEDSVSHNKTNSKLILKTNDKNLLQKYGGLFTCEIPFDGYFSSVVIPNFGD